jgi:hypothetical protein
LTSHTARQPQQSLKHTLKKTSTGDVLLKESINAIVRGYDKTAKINIPPSQPISVFRNIDSLVGGGDDPENYSRS